MGNLGWSEILIILTIALIIFGPRKLPQLGKSLGESLAQFRRASEDFKRTWEREVEVEKYRFETPLIADSATTESAAAEETPAVYGENPFEEPSAQTDEQTDSTDKKAEAAMGEPRQDWA